MKKAFIFYLTACLPLFLFAQESSLTVEQAVGCAIANNPDITAAKRDAEKASYGAAAAKGHYLPKIDITALAVKTDEAKSLNLNGIREAVIGASVASYAGAGGANPGLFKSQLESRIPSFEKKLLDDNFVRVMATVAQPVFTGFKISANSAVKKLEKDIGEINFLHAKNKVITSVIEDYYRAKFADKVIQIRKDLQTNIEGHVSNAKKLFGNGMLSKANLLRAEVALACAKKDYQTSLMDKDLASILLNNTLGIDTSGMELASPMEMLKDAKPVAYYAQKADSANTTLRLLESKKMMLRQKYKAAVGKLFPDIAAVGQYQLLQDKLTFAEPEWTIGLTASFNVFGGGSDVNEIRASKAELEALDARISSVKKLIYTAIRNFYNRCETAKKDYEALETNKILAEENLKLFRASFREGLATSLEVVDAELALTKIKIDRAKAVLDYNTAYANLLNICAMSEEELAQNNGEEK